MTGIAVGAALLGGAAIGFAATFALGALLLAWTIATGGRSSIALVVACLAAAVVGDWRGAGPPAPEPVSWADRAAGVTGQVVSAPVTNGRFQRFVIAVESAWDGGEQFAAGGRLDVTGPRLPEVELGDTVWLRGSVIPRDDHASGYADYLRSLGCGGTLFGRSLEIEAGGDDWRQPVVALRARVDDLFARAVPGDGGVLLAGLVTGDDHALSRDRRAAFVRAGASHLTAVSGSNVALLVTLASVGAGGGRRRRLSWQLGVVATIWGYAALVGMMPPAVRAALVATGAVFAVRAGRRPDLLTLLVVSAALMVLVRPGVLWSVSFQLSFAASLGLVAAVGGAAPRGILGWVGAALVTTVAAQVATLPLLVAAFGEVSPAAVPANVLLAPLALVAFPLAFAAAAAGVVIPPAGEAIAGVAALPVAAMLAVVDGLGGRSWAALAIERTGPAGSLLLAGACAVLLCLWSREGRTWLKRTLADARSAGWRLAGMVGAVAFVSVAIVSVASAID